MAQRFLRLHEVQARAGLARATIYLRISQGMFPSPVPLGSPHAVGWLDTEIDQWIADQVGAARAESSIRTAVDVRRAEGRGKREAPRRASGVDK